MVGDHVFLSGQVAIHQFCRIGSYAIVAGVSGVPQDVPPYVMADGHRARIVGLNTVGLRRNGFTQDQRNTIKAVYRILFRYRAAPGGRPAQGRGDLPGSAEAAEIVAFVQSSQRGIISFS